MTKNERLQEIREQEKFYKVLDKYFDYGWRQFVKGIQEKNDISNLRLFEILQQIKGSDFVDDLMNFMKSTKNPKAYLRLTKKPKGMLLKDARYPNIPELMIEKLPSGSYRQGNVYIQIKENRWVTFMF